MSRFFITGGAGYIGSHTAKLLAGAGREVIAYDKLSRGHRDLVRWGPLIEADIRDTSTLREAVSRFKPGAVIRFAGLAYVRESVTNPQLYFEHNVTGTLSLLKAMASIQMNNLVVSSTCAVYGQPAEVPVSEETSPRPLNPYGQSKLMMERICEDFRAAQGLHFTALRYFNACGCDPAGETGERHDPEPHLIPRALMAAEGDLAELEVFGLDYPAPDGTCIRDYIHVDDLAGGAYGGRPSTHAGRLLRRPQPGKRQGCECARDH